MEPFLLRVAHVPNANFHLGTFEEFAFAMLLALAPLANVGLAVLPLVLALPVEQVVLELANIRLSLSPREPSKAIHFVLLPLAFINFSIGPFVCATPFYHAIFERSFVGGAVG